MVTAPQLRHTGTGLLNGPVFHGFRNQASARAAHPDGTAGAGRDCAGRGMLHADDVIPGCREAQGCGSRLAGTVRMYSPSDFILLLFCRGLRLPFRLIFHQGKNRTILIGAGVFCPEILPVLKNRGNCTKKDADLADLQQPGVKYKEIQ